MRNHLRTDGSTTGTRPRLRRLIASTVDRASKPQLGPRDLIVVALWFGIAAGLLELGLVVAIRRMTTTVAMSSLRTNVHFAWMIPLADATIFGTCGLLLAWLARRRGKLAQRLGCSLFAGLLALALLVRVNGLYAVARVTLSLGLAVAGGRALDARASFLRRVTRPTLPLLASGLVLLIAVGSSWVLTSEARTLSALPESPRGAPNVILLVLDNVRAASMSLHGYGRPTTPNLERLSRRGIRFDNARSTAPWTLPSHASMFTGRWHHDLSVGWSDPLDATHPTLAECLSARGYSTAGFVGNVYYCNRRYGLDRGFARYEDYYENQTISAYEVLRGSGLGLFLLPLVGLPVKPGDGELYRRKTAAMLNRDLLDWLDQAPRERPFFAFVNYYDAHAPCVLPEGAGRRFGHARRPQHDLIEALKRFRRMNARAPRPGDGDPVQVEREAMEIFLDSYETCIAYVDEQVGRLMAELERRGLHENTWVVVTSDHGEHFNEHGFMGHGQSVYRRELDVPLLIVPPARKAGGTPAVVADPISLRELPATIVDLVGIRPEEPFPGRSLAALWDPSRRTDGAPRGPYPVLSEVGHKAHFPFMKAIPATRGAVKSVVTGGRVYIHNSDGKEELFDLSSDPLERNNLAGLDAARPALDAGRTTLSNILSGNE